MNSDAITLVLQDMQKHEQEVPVLPETYVLQTNLLDKSAIESFHHAVKMERYDGGDRTEQIRSALIRTAAIAIRILKNMPEKKSVG